VSVAVLPLLCPAIQSKELRQIRSYAIAEAFWEHTHVNDQGIVLRHYYHSVARNARKDFRDSADVPLE
jgi:hypothetical protein